MRQRNLYKRLKDGKKLKNVTFTKALFLALFLMTGASFSSSAQTPPSFVAGHHQTLTTCENAAAVDVSSMLDITDPDLGDLEIWATLGPASPNGTVSGLSTANSSTGGVTSVPAPVTYQPNTGYSGLDSFTVTVFDGTYYDTTTIVITINPVPTVGAITGLSIVCVASSLIMTDTTAGGTWTSITGTASVVGGTVTGISPGPDTIEYTVTLGACSTMVELPVTVDPIPTAGAISGPRFVCQGSTISLFDPASGGIWSATNANASVVGGTVSGNFVGVDTIRYTVSNGCGSDSVSHVVTVDVVPYVSPISGPTSMCPGATITLRDADAGGVWSATNGNATVSGSGAVTGITQGVDTIDYSLTLSCGTAVASYVVTVNGIPSPGVISGPPGGLVCVGDSINLFESVPGGYWSMTNGNASISVTGGVTGVAGGPDTAVYNVFGACGVSDTFFVISVLPLPNTGIITGPTDSVCVSATLALSETATGGSWSAANSNATVSSTGVVTGAVAGTDVISYTVISTCGPRAATFNVTVVPQPIAGSISGPSAVCVGSSIVLVDPAIGGVWSASNANATVGSTTGIVAGVTAGLETISYSVTNYCATVQATMNVTVNPLPVSGIITGSNQVCVGANITLTDPATGGVWTASNTSAAVATGTVTGSVIGVDTISYAVTNMCGTATTTHIVTVNDLVPVAAVTGLSDVCAGATIALGDVTPGGSWSSSIGGVASVSSTGVVTGIAQGVTIISYTITNICGAVSKTNTVTVDVIPVASAITGPSAICQYQLTALHDSTPHGVWSIDNGLYAYIDADGNIDGLLPGYVLVTYTVANHCGTSSTTYNVRIRPLDSCLNDGVNRVNAVALSVNVFPNPSSSSFNVLVSSDQTQDAIITVTNLVGDKVTTVHAATNKEVPVQVNAPAGIYFVNVYTEQGMKQAKIIIE